MRKEMEWRYWLMVHVTQIWQSEPFLWFWIWVPEKRDGEKLTRIIKWWVVIILAWINVNPLVNVEELITLVFSDINAIEKATDAMVNIDKLDPIKAFDKKYTLTFNPIDLNDI